MAGAGNQCGNRGGVSAIDELQGTGWRSPFCISNGDDVAAISPATQPSGRPKTGGMWDATSENDVVVTVVGIVVAVGDATVVLVVVPGTTAQHPLVHRRPDRQCRRTPVYTRFWLDEKNRGRRYRGALEVSVHWMWDATSENR
jgi:hypothetical protein